MTTATNDSIADSGTGQNHEKLRERIIETCFEIARSEGLSGLSLRRIADNADTTTQMIYTLYGDKSSLLERLYEVGSWRMIDRCRNVDAESPAEERLYQIGRQYRAFALENRKLYEAMFSSSLSEENVVKKTELFDLTVAVLEECFEKGLLQSGDAETITESFWAGIHGAIGLEISGYYADEQTAKQAYFETLRAIFDGYRVENPSPLPASEPTK